MAMDRTNADIKSSEYQQKFMQDRITAVEKYFGDLCAEFASYSRKTAKVRDKADVISQHLYDYAQNVSHNPSSKASLMQFSQNLSTIQDYRNTQVTRLEAKVVEPLKLYGTMLKQAKADLKAAFIARDKETKQKQQADKAKDSKDRTKQSIAEKELQQAHVAASRADKALEEEMGKFEKRKVQDLKKSLTDFVTVEMMFHAKALELYTVCFQNLSLLNEEDDLEEFQNSLRPESAAARLQMQRHGSKPSLHGSKASLHGSRTSLNSTNHSVANTPVTTKEISGSQIPQKNTSNMLGGDDSDDDEEEDDGSEYEDSEDEDNDYMKKR